MMQQDVEGDTMLEDSFESESSGMKSDSTNDNEAFREDFHALEQRTSLDRSHDNELKLREKLQAYKKVHRNAKVISLAVGDATEPIPQIITSAMEQSLRTQIVEVLYKGLGVKSSEVFVSDGAKGCIARLLPSCSIQNFNEAKLLKNATKSNSDKKSDFSLVPPIDVEKELHDALPQAEIDNQLVNLESEEVRHDIDAPNEDGQLHELAENDFQQHDRAENELPHDVEPLPENVDHWVRRSTRLRKQPQRFNPSLHHVMLSDEGEPLTYKEAKSSFAGGNFTESSKIRKAATFLKTNALQWWITLLNQGVVPSWVQFKQIFAPAWTTITFEVDVMIAWNQLSAVNCESLEEYNAKFWDALLPVSSFKIVPLAEQIEVLLWFAKKYCTKTRIMNMAQLMANAEVADALIQRKPDEDGFKTHRKEPQGKQFSAKGNVTLRLTVPTFKKKPFVGSKLFTGNRPFNTRNKPYVENRQFRSPSFSG
ncbi:hypothetical protein L7F22_065860 [Adiantum nelumboides]|nr:hypothetical protein [Adiantum nelumboides]